jgi:hypothetical protein
VNSVVGRMVGAALCGVFGTLAAWGFVVWVELEGVLGALAAAGLAMAVATAGFVGWTTLARSLERAK